MNLRRLEPFHFEVPLRPAKDVGARGRFEWLKPESLVIDARYQRDVGSPGRRNIKQIVENFEWAMFSPLIVSPRDDGLFAVIDGQHRAIAALTHGGLGELPCWVIAGGVEQQARAFAVINGQVTAVHPLVLFRAKLAAGDKRALAIVEAAAGAGVRILDKAVTSAAMSPGETQSPNTIGMVLGRFGREVTVAALNCITKTGAHRGMLIEAVIAAFAQVMWQAPKWRGDARLHDAIRSEGMRNLYMRALAAQTAGGGISLRTYLADTIKAVLTKRLGRVDFIAIPKTPAQLARVAEKRDRGISEHARQIAAIGRANQTRRPDGRMAAKTAPPHGATSPPAPDVAAFIAQNGVRRFESGATGDTGHLLEWLSRVCRLPASRHTQGGRAKLIYTVAGKHYDLAGLIAIVNAERKKRGMQPITSGAA